MEGVKPDLRRKQRGTSPFHHPFLVPNEINVQGVHTFGDNQKRKALPG